MSDYLPLTHENFVDPLLVPITTTKMLREEQNDPVCLEPVASLKQGEKETFSLSEDG